MPTLELNERNIDGHVYGFSKFGAKQSLRVLMRLSKIVGKPIALAVGAMGGGGPDGSPSLSMLRRDVDGEVLAQAVDALTSAMDENEVLDLIEELAGKSNLLCDGKKVEFNSHYEGRLDHLFRVVKAALEVQYGNFFSDLLARRATAPLRNASTTTQGPAA